MIEAYPLHWPDGWSRTKQPIPSRFDTKLASARDNLLNEVRLLGGRNVILSTNIPLRKDGLPYATYRSIDDTGVAVYFELDNQSQVFACDKWDLIEDNMQAIKKTIESLRGIERWGSSEMLNRVYKGFKALPEQAGPSYGDTWWSILQVSQSDSLEVIKQAYRKLSKKYHPDKLEGNPEKMTKLNWAMKQARKKGDLDE